MQLELSTLDAISELTRASITSILGIASSSLAEPLSMLLIMSFELYYQLSDKQKSNLYLQGKKQGYLLLKDLLLSLDN